MINGLLNPGYVRFDGSKFVTDATINLVGPAGPPGPQGIPGVNGNAGINGQDAYTTLASSFSQPIAGIGHPINIFVVSTAPFAANQTIFIATGGYYFINSIGSGFLNVYNLGYIGNAITGTTISNGSLITSAGPGGNSQTYQFGAASSGTSGSPLTAYIPYGNSSICATTLQRQNSAYMIRSGSMSSLVIAITGNGGASNSTTFQVYKNGAPVSGSSIVMDISVDGTGISNFTNSYQSGDTYAITFTTTSAVGSNFTQIVAVLG